MPTPIEFQAYGYTPTRAIAPLTVGEFMTHTLDARGITPRGVAYICGIPVEQVYALLEGKERLDQQTARSLEPVFPDAEHILMGAQQNAEYYKKYGRWRPRSFLGRLRDYLLRWVLNRPPFST